MRDRPQRLNSQAPSLPSEEIWYFTSIQFILYPQVFIKPVLRVKFCSVPEQKDYIYMDWGRSNMWKITSNEGLGEICGGLK